jgi:tetratricopeptide (TPR) repeat protein
MRQQRYAESLDLLQQIPPDSPEYAQAAAMRGRIHHLLNDHEGAERELACATALPKPRPEAFLYRAWLRLEQGRSADSIADALRARQLMYPGHSLAILVSGALALAYARQGQHAEATALLDRLPPQALVHVWRGWAFHFAGEPEQAYAAAEAARACDPQFSEIGRLMDALKAPGGPSAS